VGTVSSSASSKVLSEDSHSAHQLITFFRFAKIADPTQELEEHHAYIAAHDLELRGRIYLNEQGINAQMSGRGTDGAAHTGPICFSLRTLHCE
jgi:predicted sulfurtransferase